MAALHHHQNPLLQLPGPMRLLLLAALAAVRPCAAVSVPLRAVVTMPYKTLQVSDLPPPAPRPSATSQPIADLRAAHHRPRQQDDDFNTICGYIGGDPALPATCSAGSHCVVDVGLGAIGCCPNGGPCTTGVFTGCVDHNSPAQTVVDPYVYTCGGRDVCYQNRFDGGLFQYGCGTDSKLATTVPMTASGLTTKLRVGSISVTVTDGKVTLSTPTRIGSASSTSTESSTTTENPSSTGPAGSLQTDPNIGPSNPGPDRTGAIIGGTIAGVAVLSAIIALAYYCWRERRGNVRHGPGIKGEKQFISPVSGQQFDRAPNVDPFQLQLQAGYGPQNHPYGATAYSHGMYGGAGAGILGPGGYHDEVPFSSSYPEGLARIGEEEEEDLDEISGPTSSGGPAAAASGAASGPASGAATVSGLSDETSGGANGAGGAAQVGGVRNTGDSATLGAAADVVPLRGGGGNDDGAGAGGDLGLMGEDDEAESRPLWQQAQRHSRNMVWR